MSSHDYAECQDQACDLCDANDEGYSDGKAQALFEAAIATCHISTTPECRCSPCVGLRYALFTMGEGSPGPSAPAPKPGRCVGCGREGMVINSVCQRCWA